MSIYTFVAAFLGNLYNCRHYRISGFGKQGANRIYPSEQIDPFWWIPIPTSKGRYPCRFACFSSRSLRRPHCFETCWSYGWTVCYLYALQLCSRSVPPKAVCMVRTHGRRSARHNYDRRPARFHWISLRCRSAAFPEVFSSLDGPVSLPPKTTKGLRLYMWANPFSALNHTIILCSRKLYEIMHMLR